MQIQGISTSDPIFGSSATPRASGQLGQESFMTLLVEQLKNQDPLEPTGNEEFIAELANFSSLEQMELLNDNLLGLAVLQQSNALLSQLTEGSALIGQQVRYFDGESHHSGTVESVKIENGQATLNIGGRSIPLGNVTEVLGTPAPGEAAA